ncbi:MAG: rRNA maturation RNase YbeY [Chloroflexi bacterium]|nr:rRNA maturation RNase YbeY [Chloroflexota bacterium]
MTGDFRVDVSREDPFKRKVKVGWLRKVAEDVLRSQGIEAPAEMGLVIAGDELVQRLNKEYRGLDHTTDVLSFALEEGPEGGAAFVMPSDGVRHLGEVIISYPQAARQAEQQKHPVERELTILIIHGILHLLGYDHESDAEEATMKAQESRLIADCGLGIADC